MSKRWYKMFRTAQRSLGWDQGRLLVASGFLGRLRGLLFRAPVDADGNPWVMGIPRCSAVHTCFMRYPIDVAFIAEDGRAFMVVHALPPWRFVRMAGAVAVMERPSCSALDAPGGAPAALEEKKWEIILLTCLLVLV